MKKNSTGSPPRTDSSHKVSSCAIDAKFIASQTGPQPVAPSPAVATATRCAPSAASASRMRSAAPVAMPAEPPTIALFG